MSLYELTKGGRDDPMTHQAPAVAGTIAFGTSGAPARLHQSGARTPARSVAPRSDGVRCQRCYRRVRPPRRKWCSDRCLHAAWEGRPAYRERRCVGCGVEFRVRVRRGGAQRYCTVECWRTFRARPANRRARTAELETQRVRRAARRPVDYTPGHQATVAGRRVYVRAVVHTCPACGSDALRVDDDGVWMCDGCLTWRFYGWLRLKEQAS